MSIKHTKPAETYDGLKTQFLALKKILECKEAEVNVYRKRIKEFSLDRITKLEAELESERAMNTILTDELDKFCLPHDTIQQPITEMLPIKAKHKFFGDVDILGVRIECNGNNNKMYMVKDDGEYYWVYDYETELI